MAGSMNWTGMENLISEVNNTKSNWVSAAETAKSTTVQKLEAAYAGKAADATAAKMDEVISAAKNYFDTVADEISKKLAEQKAAWEDQEAKAQSSVEG